MRLITVEDDRDTPDGAAGDDEYLPQVPHTPQLPIVPGTSASSPLTASSGESLMGGLVHPLKLIWLFQDAAKEPLVDGVFNLCCQTLV